MSALRSAAAIQAEANALPILSELGARILTEVRGGSGGEGLSATVTSVAAESRAGTLAEAQKAVCAFLVEAGVEEARIVVKLQVADDDDDDDDDD